MRKTLIFTIILFSAIFVFGQKENSSPNYKKGLKALHAKNYTEAISLLTMAIEQNPTALAYLNRSEAYYNTGDSCAFCMDLKTARLKGNYDAYKKFRDKCQFTTSDNPVPDSILKKHPYVVDIEIIHDKCDPDSIVYAASKNEDESWSDEISKIEDVPIYTLIEKMPQFVGGDDARNRFLSENLKYTEDALNKGIEGTVYVAFVVEKDGSVSNVKILRGIDKGLDNEVLRITRLLPRWIPGTQDGKPKRVLFNMPVYFKLKGRLRL
ncbi:MAG: TonB family protein [Bacteroidota bacterium]